MTGPVAGHGGNAALIQQFAPIVVGVVVLGLVLLRNRRGRRLRLELMWVMPLIILLAAGALFWGDYSNGARYDGLTLGIFFAALVAGAGVGWWRGSLMLITIDPATEALTTQASPIGLVLIMSVFVLRYALRLLLPNSGPITDGFMLFAVGLVVTQRIEMWLRARRQLAIARAGGSTSSE